MHCATDIATYRLNQPGADWVKIFLKTVQYQIQYKLGPYISVSPADCAQPNLYSNTVSPANCQNTQTKSQNIGKFAVSTISLKAQCLNKCWI